MSLTHAEALEVARSISNVQHWLAELHRRTQAHVRQNEHGGVIQDLYSRLWDQICTAENALLYAKEAAVEIAEQT